MLHKDNNGTEIDIGCKVVFNRSGELETGFVKEIKFTKRKDWRGVEFDKPTFYVKADRFPNLSKVQYACSLMVIK